jgi:cytochrome c-type biogenesis protein CcmH/NrfG
MSILDGLPTSELQFKEAVKLAGPMMDRMLDELKVSTKQQNVIDLMMKGVSLADIYGLTKEQREALFLKGCRMIQVGQTKKARDWLAVMFQLDPLDKRVIYALALTFQIEGNVSKAAKLFIYFLGLDPTNPEGYLRLGECFLVAGEHENAHGSFEFAKILCGRGHGNARVAALADKMTAEVAQRLKPSTQHALKQ